MNEGKKQIIIKEIFDWMKDLFIALLVTLFIITFVFQNTQVIGDSMIPTLQDGNAVIVNKFIYRFQHPKRGDIIAFRYSHNPSQYFIKRIIGVEGDEVDIQYGNVYLNGELINEDYIYEPMDQGKIGDMEFPMTVSKNTCFVMGDNRNISFDSRYTEVGLIPLSSISGKAFFRIWPLNKIGFVE